MMEIRQRTALRRITVPELCEDVKVGDCFVVRGKTDMDTRQRVTHEMVFRIDEGWGADTMIYREHDIDFVAKKFPVEERRYAGEAGYCTQLNCSAFGSQEHHELLSTEVPA